MKKRCWMVLFVMGGLLLAFFSDAQEVQTLAGFSVPEYDREGNMKSQLFGDYAEFLPGGEVRITNLKIEFYEDGEISMHVTAPQCEYEEQDKEAESDGSVRIARGDMIVTGTGFEWSARKQRLEIHNDAKVVLKGMRQHMEPGEEE